MKVALIEFDSYTITWFRVAGAFLLMFVARANLWASAPRAFLRHFWGVILSGCFLAVYFYAFVKGIEVGGPMTAAITIQIGPIALALIGFVFFHEKLIRVQIVGAFIAILGFVVFFYSRLSGVEEAQFQLEAVIIVSIAAISWAGFCVGQKIIGTTIGANLLNFITFLFAALLLFPIITYPRGEQLATWSFAAIVYLSVSTFIAYWALGEAIRLLPVSIVSFFITLNPFVTIICVQILLWLGNDFFEPQPLTFYGYIGSCMALLGVAGATLRRR